ncbi:MAG: NAD(P)H-hydrate epimerase [Phycisphaerales bacterium]|nr:NAD(P)H-hydrate epimerase [Phycisphaerales bacterium]
MHHRPPVIVTLSRQEVRELDRRACEELGMPGILLMENAAAAIEEVALGCLAERADPGVLILCGPGNNGGDGLALARRLHNRAVRVVIVLTAPEERYRGDAAAMLGIVRRMELDCRVLEGSEVEAVLDAALQDAGGDGALIVDALLGTGLDRPLEGVVASVVAWINRARERGSEVLSVDVPSGMDADTGQELGVAVRATVTVTLAAMKPGLLKAPGLAGRVEVGDIGVPRELLRRSVAR